VFLNSTAGGASTTYVESDGSLSYNPSNNTLTVGSGVLLCNTLRPQSGNTLVLDGNGNGLIVFQSLSVTTARLDNIGLYVNSISTIDVTSDLELFASTNKAVNLWSSGGLRFSATSEGTWMPVSASKSFYITDTAPRTATTTYYRLFGLSGTVYNDYHNRVMWRSTNLAGSGEINTMYLRSSGLNIPLSTATHPDLDAYELVVGNNSATEGVSAKIIVRGKASVTTSGANKGPSIDFTSWDTHSTPQASIEVLDDNNWGGIFRLKAKANGAGSIGALTEVLQARVTGFRFQADPQFGVNDASYVYASDSASNLYRVCQQQTFQFNQDGAAWTGGVVLGSFAKRDGGSKISWVASATQYTTGASTMVFQVAFTNVSTGTVYAYNQNTFTNIGSAHWVCPNIQSINTLPAGTYAVSVSGNWLSDGNDYVRLQITISPA
jgi:hypothetical protein